MYHRGIYGDPSIGGDDPGAGLDDYLATPPGKRVHIALRACDSGRPLTSRCTVGPAIGGPTVHSQGAGPRGSLDSPGSRPGRRLTVNFGTSSSVPAPLLVAAAVTRRAVSSRPWPCRSGPSWWPPPPAARRARPADQAGDDRDRRQQSCGHQLPEAEGGAVQRVVPRARAGGGDLFGLRPQRRQLVRPALCPVGDVGHGEAGRRIRDEVASHGGSGAGERRPFRAA